MNHPLTNEYVSHHCQQGSTIFGWVGGGSSGLNVFMTVGSIAMLEACNYQTNSQVLKFILFLPTYVIRLQNILS